MSVIGIALSYFKKHKLNLMLIIFLIVLVTLIALVPAQVLRLIVDDGIANKKSTKLFIFSLSYGISFILVGIITFIKDLVLVSTSQKITEEIRNKMMDRLHQISYKELVSKDAGTLEAYFSNDVNSINELFTSGVINLTTDVFKMIGILVSLFIYSYKFGLIILGVLPFLVLFTSIIRKKMMASQLRTKGLEENVNQIMLENVENIEQIKSNKATEYGINKYDKILKNHYKASQANNFYDALFSPVMQIVRNLVIVGILLICGYNTSFFGMSVGMVISSISLISDLFSPIEALGMEIQTIQKSLASVKRINQYFKLEVKEKNVETMVESISFNLKDVYFKYADSDFIKGFNLCINDGDRIVLHGPSGAGKSTIMKLIMGELKPTSGKVMFGGIDTYLLSDEIKKKMFSIVYQDPFFSNGTIYEEISLLDTSISKEDVLEALKTVGLGYITNIDEVLIKDNYSSGELSLFNIARVVARDSRVIFLDEMNAKIDPVTAKEIMAVIERISIGKIVVSINHYGDILKDAKIINL